MSKQDRYDHTCIFAVHRKNRCDARQLRLYLGSGWGESHAETDITGISPKVGDIGLGDRYGRLGDVLIGALAILGRPLQYGQHAQPRAPIRRPPGFSLSAGRSLNSSNACFHVSSTSKGERHAVESPE